MSASYDLNALFTPNVVAVIGASAKPGKIGNTVVQNLIDAGYEGKIIPVNPKSTEILGLPVTHNISELQGLVWLYNHPQQICFGFNEELDCYHVKSAIIITVGFKEVVAKVRKWRNRSKELCEKNNGRTGRSLTVWG